MSNKSGFSVASAFEDKPEGENDPIPAGRVWFFILNVTRWFLRQCFTEIWSAEIYLIFPAARKV